MTHAYWQTAREGDALIARFSNPPMNYYCDEAVAELTELVEGWAQTDARAIILTGYDSGRFITHFSADEIRQGVEDQLGAGRRGPVRNQSVNRVLESMTRLEVPVIAALDGDTMGFGYELALACDFRVGQRGDFRYGLPESRLGIIPGSGGTQRLVRLVGLGKALDIVMRGRVLPPEEALEWGLITELHDSALEGALTIVADIARNPRMAVAAAKRALHLGADTTLSAALTIESDANLRTKLGPEVVAQLDSYLAIAPEARRDWLERG